MTASGTVEDYTPIRKNAIVERFAAAAGVTPDRVSIEVLPASVRLVITIVSPTPAAAELVHTALAPSLASPAAAAALIPDNMQTLDGSIITIESKPTIVLIATGLSPSLPPPLSPPLVPQSVTLAVVADVTSVGFVAVSGIIASGLLTLALLLWLAYKLYRRRQTHLVKLKANAHGDKNTRTSNYEAVDQIPESVA